MRKLFSTAIATAMIGAMTIGTASLAWAANPATSTITASGGSAVAASLQCDQPEFTATTDKISGTLTVNSKTFTIPVTLAGNEPGSAFPIAKVTVTIPATDMLPDETFNGTLTCEQTQVELEVKFSKEAKATDVDRISGDNREETSLEVAGDPAFSGATEAIVSTSRLAADALAATPLAVKKGAPIVLVKDAAGASKAATILKERGYKTITIAGREGAVSEPAAQAFRDGGMTVARLGGENRYGTAVKLADEMLATTTVDKVFVADGIGYADALSIGSIAVKASGMTVLSQGDVLPTETKEFLAKNPKLQVVAVGGPAAAALKAAGVTVSKEIVGVDRYATAAQVAATYQPNPAGVVIASGENFADALVAGPFAGRTNQALLLTMAQSFPTASGDQIKAYNTKNGTIIGGPGAVDPKVATAIYGLLAH